MDADIGDFLLDRRTQGASAKTLLWYKDALAKFRDYCAVIGAHRTSDVSARVLRSYLAFLSDRGHNEGGISNLYRAVRAFLRWSEREFELPALTAALQRVPNPSSSTEPLDPIPLDHVTAMVAQCTPRTFTGERDKALLLTLLDTGIRHQ
jgi:site-specific recombinase XerD